MTTFDIASDPKRVSLVIQELPPSFCDSLCLCKVSPCCDCWCFTKSIGFNAWNGKQHQYLIFSCLFAYNITQDWSWEMGQDPNYKYSAVALFASYSFHIFSTFLDEILFTSSLVKEMIKESSPSCGSLGVNPPALRFSPRASYALRMPALPCNAARTINTS